MNTKRVRQLKKLTEGGGPVVYWMQRDQRASDNWALIFALEKAKELNTSVVVCFCVVEKFFDAAARQYRFMLEGLKQVESSLKKKNIAFKLLSGKPGLEIPKFAEMINASLIVSDFNPMKIIREWEKSVLDKTEISHYCVDAHNIVPCWEASDKAEFAAYTIRPKINKLLPEFIDEFPETRQEKNVFSFSNDWEKAERKLKINFDVKEIDWLKPGEDAAKKTLRKFIETKFKDYAELRNDPNSMTVSDMSPYIHFGQISAQRIALDIQPFIEYQESQKAFLEELIIRRELSDNFCFYNKNYDSFDGFHSWAKDTLNNHRRDKREYIYLKDDFENAATHDDLWNAAQIEMTRFGKMHGYMRMYWAKKILEWTKSPEEALETAIYLNDKYELDGRDPNGYTGIAWSIGGVHDRAWTERSVFGKIRYMNYNGCKRKFNVDKYITKNFME